MSKLSYSEFFPTRAGQGWYYYLSEVLHCFPKVVKASWQRARRGWADCDVWSIDTWFCAVVPDMLRKLGRTKYGIPSDFLTYDENEEIVENFETQQKHWKGVLEQMANDLEAQNRLWDADDLLETMTTNELANIENAARSKVRAGLASFYEWFDALWD